MGQLPTLYQEFIAISRYARWKEDLKRRETWNETVSRYIDFWKNRFDFKQAGHKNAFNDSLKKAKEMILNLEIMPSMRCMMTAGEALEKDQIAGFNCTYTAIETPKRFDEIMYILMCGCGVGFSVEQQYVDRLPVINKRLYPSQSTVMVEDSKIGWATGYRELISLLYTGKIPKWDLSQIRPAGARLKTFGGRASGPGPLNDLFEFTVNMFQRASGRKLTSLECHDLVCKVADIVVSGGVRRSALISLSDLSDARMREAKTGQWWETNGQRALANNSAIYNEKPTVGTFLDEWKSLIESKSGERGIVNREALQKQAGRNGRRDPNHQFGTNPCSEIILRPNQTCNLTEAVLRPEDNLETIGDKVEWAAFLGTLQSTLTDFRYLSEEWKRNCDEERLLGVSLTGIVDCPWFLTAKKDELESLRERVVTANAWWSSVLGISQSTATTCVKPSGTVSQLVNAASGIHPRYSQYYIRTVRCDAGDPVAKLMIEQGFPWEVDVTKQSNVIFSFPMKSPEKAIFRNDFDAMEQMKLWLRVQKFWCEHKPSITVYVKEDEWIDVGAYVYKYFDEMSGVSFLPHSDHIYKQAPYQEITEEEYNEWVKKMPKKMDWSELARYETEDQTTSAKELACSGSSCELI